RTNCLQTESTTTVGLMRATNFRPIAVATLFQMASLHERPRLVRLVECIGGEVVVRSELQPAPDYARTGPDVFQAAGGRFHADVGDRHYCIRATVPVDGPQTSVHMACGDRLAFALMVSHRGACPAGEWD